MSNRPLFETNSPPVDPSAPRVHIDLTVDQARAVCFALDIYGRLCIGQLEAVEWIVRDGTIPVQRESREKRAEASSEICQAVEQALNLAKAHLGYPSNGSNGIGHRHVDATGHRAYELRKVLAREMAMLRDPNPTFRGVDYDGLGPRYTQDPAPMPKLSDAEVSARVHAYPRLAVCQECAIGNNAQWPSGHMATWWTPGECCLCGAAKGVCSTRDWRWPQKYAQANITKCAVDRT